MPLTPEYLGHLDNDFLSRLASPLCIECRLQNDRNNRRLRDHLSAKYGNENYYRNSAKEQAAEPLQIDLRVKLPLGQMKKGVADTFEG